MSRVRFRVFVFDEGEMVPGDVHVVERRLGRGLVQAVCGRRFRLGLNHGTCAPFRRVYRTTEAAVTCRVCLARELNRIRTMFQDIVPEGPALRAVMLTVGRLLRGEAEPTTQELDALRQDQRRTAVSA